MMGLETYFEDVIETQDMFPYINSYTLIGLSIVVLSFWKNNVKYFLISVFQ